MLGLLQDYSGTLLIVCVVGLFLVVYYHKY